MQFPTLADRQKPAEPISMFEFQGNQLRVFEFDETGYEFIVSDVARALGYNGTHKATELIKRHAREFDDLTSMRWVSTSQGVRNATMVTEIGLYCFAFLSKTDIATEFRRNVAELLQGIRAKQVQVMPTSEIEKLQLELEVLRQKKDLARNEALPSLLLAFRDRIGDSMLMPLLGAMAGLAVPVERTYTATETALKLSGDLSQAITARRVGMAITKLGWRPKPGQPENDYLVGSVTNTRAGTLVPTVRYKDRAVQDLLVYFTRNPVTTKGKSRQGTLELPASDLAG